MTAITDTSLETTILSAPTSAELPTLIAPMFWSALREHVLGWLDYGVRLALGIALGVGLLAAAQWPSLGFLAAFSAASGLLYLTNLGDVERYRDSILFVVPTLFIWVMLGIDADNAALVGLTLFTHVFLAFFASFARVTGALREMRLWPLLLGLDLSFLIYLVNSFLV